MGTPPKEIPDLLRARTGVGLVEREAELAVVERLLEESSDRCGGLLVLEGPAGIGKTELLQAVHMRAREARMWTLRARAGEFERNFSYGVVRQLYEPLMASVSADERSRLLAGAAALAAPLFKLGEGGQLAGGDPAHGTLHGLFWLTANAAERAPLLISVDDLHWSDVPSLRFLLYLVRRVEGLAALVVVTIRTGEGEADSPILDDLRSDSTATVLALEPLSPAGISALVRGRLESDPAAEFSGAVRSWTGGNPLLIRQLLTAAAARGIEPTAAAAPALEELAPEGVARFALRRLAPLGPRAVELARALALLGEDGDLSQAARLAGLAYEDAASTAQALRRIELLDEEERPRFVHPIVRRAIVDSLPPHERESAHARAAELLAESGAPAARVAAHLLAVRPREQPERVVGVLRDAAREALAQGAPEAATAYLSRALVEPPADEDRGHVLLELGVAEARTRAADAASHLLEAIDLIDDDDALADAAIELANALQFTGRGDALGEMLERVAARIEDASAARRVEAELIWLAGYRVRHRRLVQDGLARHPPQRCGEDLADRQLLAMHASEAARAGQDPGEALRLARTALADGALVRERDAPAFSVPASVLIYLDHFDEASAVLHEALLKARRTGAAYLFVMASWLRADLHLRRGDLAEAEADATNAVEAVTILHSFHSGSRLLGDLCVERGDIDGAAGYLDNPESGREEPGSWEGAFRRASRGRLRALQGRDSEAAADLLETGGWLQAMGAENPAYLPWRTWAAATLVRLGDRDRALRLAHEEVELARTWGAPRALGISLRSAGLLEGGDDGLRLLEEAVEVLADSPALLERARALTEHGAALRRANRRKQARELLAGGVELAERCSAVLLAERARAELVATGARPRRTMRSGEAALTPSERRVAQLAAAGHTNRDIAQALFVTPKTIENHLSHAYQKLGIRSRSQLPGALAKETSAPTGTAYI